MVAFRVDKEITVREFREDDAEEVFRAVKENYGRLVSFMDWITPEYSITSAEEFIVQSVKGREERTNLSLGIFRSDRFIGSIGFVHFDWAAMKTEIGYWIAAEDEGKGIVSRAVTLLIAFAIRELGINRIEIRCSAENLRSSAIPLRLGFQKEGHLRRSEFRNGRLHDFEIYGLLASEWESGDERK